MSIDTPENLAELRFPTAVDAERYLLDTLRINPNFVTSPSCSISGVPYVGGLKGFFSQVASPHSPVPDKDAPYQLTENGLLYARIIQALLSGQSPESFEGTEGQLAAVLDGYIYKAPDFVGEGPLESDEELGTVSLSDGMYYFIPDAVEGQKEGRKRPRPINPDVYEDFLRFGGIERFVGRRIRCSIEDHPRFEGLKVVGVALSHINAPVDDQLADEDE